MALAKRFEVPGPMMIACGLVLATHQTIAASQCELADKRTSTLAWFCVRPDAAVLIISLTSMKMLDHVTAQRDICSEFQKESDADSASSASTPDIRQACAMHWRGFTDFIVRCYR
jgi:hypothetical protein